METSPPFISFYPGPSQLNPAVRQYLIDAYDTGILSRNHRSPEFMVIMQKTIDLLHEKLNIPSGYTIFFTSSATECWEIIAQSLLHNGSLHLYSGTFGEKWYEATKKLASSVVGFPYQTGKNIEISHASLPFDKNSPYLPILCLTHCDTSNSAFIDAHSTKYLYEKYKKNILITNYDEIMNDLILEHQTKLLEEYPTFPYLLAYDATSSLGGVGLNFKDTDIVFASVQKCFGLPAGLAVMVCSPAAINQALAINDRKHYNSLPVMYEQIQNFQPTHTPNMLAIYLLMRILEDRKSINSIHQEIYERARKLRSFLKEQGFQLLETGSGVSPTLLVVKGEKEWIKSIKEKAVVKNILLGNGYGEWKDTTFRIANFPSISDEDFELLKVFLADVVIS